jgi:3-dehydroquinate synthase
MRKVRVRLGRSGYTVRIGAGALAQAGQVLEELGCRGKAVIVTDPTVRDLYGTSLKQSLAGLGYKTALFEIPVGEEYKSLETAGRLYGELTEFGAERGTPVLALGGGVIGDVAGFVAATYLRGVPLIQLPTTLLAQVDSSIGGKVAINHGQLKNRIGSFYQPRAVISDTTALQTLPASELASGLGEVIKYAIIRDREFFDYLVLNIAAIRALDVRVLEHVVAACARIKAEVVEKDEKDTGLRNILNFGHTVGHAIETVSDFSVAHGQAVSIGMMAACQIAAIVGEFEDVCLVRVRRLLRSAGLMTKMPPLDLKAVMAAMALDKKVSGGNIRFVLPRNIGEVFVTEDVSAAVVEKVLAGLR